LVISYKGLIFIKIIKTMATISKLYKIRIKLKSIDFNLVDKAVKTIIKALKPSNAIFNGPIPLKVTLNKEYVRSMEICYSENSKVTEILMKLVLPDVVDVEIKL